MKSFVLEEFRFPANNLIIIHGLSRLVRSEPATLSAADFPRAKLFPKVKKSKQAARCALIKVDVLYEQRNEVFSVEEHGRRRTGKRR